MGTKIEWTDEVWNPVVGCSKVSPGCLNCYAERMDQRLILSGRRNKFHPWTANNAERNVTLHPERLEQPLLLRRPRKIFVCSMSDLFHEQVPSQFFCSIMVRIERAKHHTFQILTKRAERMAKAFEDIEAPSNTWLGISAEDQPTLDYRAPWLRQTPATVRWVSFEPLLGPVDATEALRVLDWVVVGGESGPGARPMSPDWVRSLRDQCNAAGVPFFFKQWGAWNSQGVRVGKKAAGAMLDGQERKSFPHGD